MENLVLIHYGELALKHGNRDFFEERLMQNIRRATADIPAVTVKKTFGRFLLFYEDRDQETKIKQALLHVFGIANFAFAKVVKPELEIIAKALLEMISPVKTFAVDVRRINKNLPFTSEEAEIFLGQYLRDHGCPGKVDLKNPELTFHVDCVNNDAFVYTEKIPGLGGLPIGTSGKVISLLSSGIDSPIAAWKMMKRGCEVSFVHFHSYPQTSAASQENVKALVKILTKYQFRSTLYLVPFLEAQKAIMKKADPALAVILYRRCMLRIAEKIARQENAISLVTGDNLGQVASQTLENMAAVQAAVSIPVLRPLLTYDKQEIIAEAKKIGTYDISIEPYEDCCSLFVPPHPELKANPLTLASLEKEHDFDAMIEPMLAQMEIIEVNASSGAPAGIQSRNGGLRRGAAEPVSTPLTTVEV